MAVLSSREMRWRAAVAARWSLSLVGGIVARDQDGCAIDFSVELSTPLQIQGFEAVHGLEKWRVGVSVGRLLPLSLIAGLPHASRFCCEEFKRVIFTNQLDLMAALGA